MIKIVKMIQIDILNPDFAVGFVMKASNAIKTSVCEDFFLESIVNYANSKKWSKHRYLKHLELGIESLLQILG